MGKDLAPVSRVANQTLTSFTLPAQRTAADLSGLLGFNQAQQRITAQANQNQKYLQATHANPYLTGASSALMAPGSAAYQLAFKPAFNSVMGAANATAGVKTGNLGYALNQGLNSAGNLAQTLTLGSSTPIAKGLEVGLPAYQIGKNVVSNTIGALRAHQNPIADVSNLVSNPTPISQSLGIKNPLAAAVVDVGTDPSTLYSGYQIAKNLPQVSVQLIKDAQKTISPHDETTVAKTIGNLGQIFAGRENAPLKDVIAHADQGSKPAIDRLTALSNHYLGGNYGALSGAGQVKVWRAALGGDAGSLKPVASELNHITGQGGFINPDLLTGGLASKDNQPEVSTLGRDTTVYRGTTTPGGAINPAKPNGITGGESTSIDRATAERFAQSKGGEVQTHTLPSDARVVDHSALETMVKDVPQAQKASVVQDYLQKNNIDVVRFDVPGGKQGEGELRVVSDRALGAANPTAPTAPSGNVLSVAKGKLNTLSNLGSVAFDRARNNIASQGEGGQKLSQNLQLARDMHEVLAGGWFSKLPTVRSLSSQEFPNFVDSVEGNAQPLSAKVAQAVSEWKSLSPQIHAAATEVGDNGQPLLNTGNIENYFPHTFAPGTFNNPDRYKAAIDHLVATGQATDATDAATKLSAFIGSSNAHKYGNLEQSRTLDLPNYQKTSGALVNYVNNAAKRISEAQVFGPKDEKSMALVGQIANEGGDAELAKHYYDVARGANADTAAMKSVSSSIRGALRIPGLSFSAIAHSQQSVNTASVVGALRTALAASKAFSPASKDFALQAGVTLDKVLSEARKPSGFVNRVLGKVVGPALQNVVAFNKTLTAVAGRDYADALATKVAKGDTGAISELEKMGIKASDVATQGGKLTPDQQITAARNIVERTQFRADPQDLPGWASSPMGKLVAQFKSYSYNQTAFVGRELLAPARNGNVLPLARFLGLGLVTGGLVNETTNVLQGKPNVFNGELNQTTPGSLVAGAYEKAGLFGLPGQIGASALSSYPGESAADKTINLAGSVFGPTVSKTLQTTKNIYTALTPNTPGGTNHLAPLGREALREIPVAGQALANTLLPSQSSAGAPITPPVSAAEVGPATQTGPLTPVEVAKLKAQKTALTKQKTQVVNTAGPGLLGGGLSDTQKNQQLSTIQAQIAAIDKQLKAPPIDALTKKVDAAAANQGTDILSTGLANNQKKSLATSIGKQVLAGTLTSDQAAPLLQKLGTDPKQLEYTMAKSLSTPDQAQYVLSAIQRGDTPLALIQAGVLTTPVINSLYSTGDISSADAKLLKSGVSTINNPTKTVTGAKAKKGKAVKIATPKTYKIPTLKAPKAALAKSPKIKGIKLAGIKNSGLKTPKTLKIKGLASPSTTGIKVSSNRGTNFRLPRQTVEKGTRLY